MGLTGAAKAQYTFTTFDVPGATQFFVDGINGTGQIVGSYYDADRSIHGFLRDMDGNYTTLDVPGADWTQAFGINASGQVVGSYTDLGGIQHGFLATPVP
jgi:probable HAF family extracellular repeat protein